MSPKSASKTAKPSTASGSRVTLETKMRRVKLSELKLLDVNARYMDEAMYARLVENLRLDGCLTTAPTVCAVNGALEVLSGNHRVQAAIEAGIAEADVIEIVTPLNQEQRIAIQLSHNAIEGEDDPSVLKSLYDQLGFDFKEYSGLTDEAFEVGDIDTSVLATARPFYQDVVVAFLPEDEKVFADCCEAIEKGASAKEGKGEGGRISSGAAA